MVRHTACMLKPSHSRIKQFGCSCSSWDGCEFYEIWFEQKPVTTNAERASNRWVRADLTKVWRESAFYKSVGLPKAQWLIVIAEPSQEKGRLQDVGACNPSVKAIIDGLVDRKIILDDSGGFVPEIRFLPAVRGKNGLKIKIVLKRFNT